MYRKISIAEFLGFLVLFLIIAGTTGCKHTESASSDSMTDREARLETLYWSRQDSAQKNFSQADVKFMRGMIAHHAQALVMSRLAPENGASESIQTLTARIINAQSDEIETMQRWLEARNQPVPRIQIDSLDLTITINGKLYTAYKKMPGVLAEEKLHELARAKGRQFDRLFLKYMIQHHKGAVIMVDNLFSKDGAAQGESTFRLAQNIQVDQRTEIDRMNRMLDRLSSTQ